MNRTILICAVTLMMLTITACGAVDNASAAGCKAYVAETRDACLDMIRRGLDVSCKQQITAIEIAMKQANGSLFDIGDGEANERAAQALCSSYLGDLHKARAAQNAKMLPKGDTGPKCAALAQQIKARCLARLGQAPLAGGCRAALTLMSMNGATAPAQREQRCAMAAGMLPDT